MFLICLGLFAFPWIYYLHLYIRVLIGIVFLPLLDPDFDLQLSEELHRWALSHSIIPALVIWYCFEPAFNEYGKIIFVIFAFYPITHLIGDLKLSFRKSSFGGTWQIAAIPKIRRIKQKQLHPKEYRWAYGHPIFKTKEEMDKEGNKMVWDITWIRLGILGSWIWYLMNIGIGIGLMMWVII